MTFKRTLMTLCAPLAALCTLSLSAQAACPDFLQQEVRKLNSKKTVNLCDLYSEKKPMLIVNTASNCGYTSQFKELEALYQKYKDQGLQVIGVPSNSFKQEEKDEAKTASVCYINYGVTFTMLETSPVKGDQANPLFAHLSEKSQAPSWNFNKYVLTDSSVTHYKSNEKPLGGELEAQIASLLPK